MASWNRFGIELLSSSIVWCCRTRGVLLLISVESRRDRGEQHLLSITDVNNQKDGKRRCEEWKETSICRMIGTWGYVAMLVHWSWESRDRQSVGPSNLVSFSKLKSIWWNEWRVCWLWSIYYDWSLQVEYQRILPVFDCSYRSSFSKYSLAMATDLLLCRAPWSPDEKKKASSDQWPKSTTSRIVDPARTE